MAIHADRCPESLRKEGIGCVPMKMKMRRGSDGIGESNEEDYESAVPRRVRMAVPRRVRMAEEEDGDTV